MGIELKGGILLCLIFAVLFTDISGAGASALAERNANPPCNATIAYCIDEDEGESDFLIESEVNRRSLQNRPPPITYGALQKPPACNANKYGNCIGPLNPQNRPCSFYDRCKRSQAQK